MSPARLLAAVVREAYPIRPHGRPEPWWRPLRRAAAFVALLALVVVVLAAAWLACVTVAALKNPP